MEAIPRITDSQDAVSLIFLLILLMWTLAHVWDRQRFIRLFSLGIDSFYIVAYKESVSRGFQTIMVIPAVLSWGLFGWKLLAYYGLISRSFSGFILIVATMVGYLLLKWGVEYFISILFDLQKYYIRSFFVKLSYGNSYSMYLTILLVPWYYTFKDSGTYRHFIIIAAVFFILLRYFHYMAMYKKMIMSRIFYFILYFCTLEIAPIIWLIKTVFNPRGI